MHSTRAMTQQCKDAHDSLTGIRVMLQRQPYTDMHETLLSGSRATLQRQQQAGACNI